MGAGHVNLARTTGVVVTLLLFAGPAHAAWLMDNGNAARTGAAGEGPAWGDVAFVARIEGDRPYSTGIFRPTPIILGNAAYILTVRNFYDPPGGFNGTTRIDLDSGEVARVHEFGDDIGQEWASDGARFFVLHLGHIAAYDLEGGEAVWSTPYPEVVPNQAGAWCNPPAVRDGRVYFQCRPWGPEEAGSFALAQTFAAAADAETGAILWTWHKSAVDETTRGRLHPAAEGVLGPLRSEGYGYSATIPLGLSIVGPLVVSATLEIVGAAGTLKGFLWALDEQTGSLMWSVNATSSEDPYYHVANPSQRRLTSFIPPAVATGTEDAVFAEFETLLALNPTRGNLLWERPLRDADAIESDLGSGFALEGDALYVATGHTIHRFDHTRDAPPLWSYTLPPGAPSGWAFGGLGLANGSLYARGFYGNFPYEPVTGAFVEAIDIDTGRPRWRVDLPIPEADPDSRYTPHYTLAIGNGVLVASRFDGEVTVIGQTAASISPTAIASATHPAPGETVRIDLSGTAPGIGGPATRYRAEWGDGNETEWQTSPVFEYAYQSAGARTARFHAANDANQSSSLALAFDVGGTPPEGPPELTFMQRAFAPEYQEWTFFVLGLVVTGVGGLIGVLGIRRQRGILRRELARIERAGLDARDSTASERALAAERKRVRDLLLHGTVTEAQFSVLTERIDELVGAARLTTLDDRFRHLPLSMVEELRAMLADGRVTVLERGHFLDALARDALLTLDQKQQVRAMIDAWFAADAPRA